MQLAKLDLVIWDDGEYMMASAVSPYGVEFLSSMTGLPCTIAMNLEVSPEDLCKNMPPKFVAIINGVGGICPLKPETNRLQ